MDTFLTVLPQFTSCQVIFMFSVGSSKPGNNSALVVIFLVTRFISAAGGFTELCAAVVGQTGKQTANIDRQTVTRCKLNIWPDIV